MRIPGKTAPYALIISTRLATKCRALLCVLLMGTVRIQDIFRLSHLRHRSFVGLIAAQDFLLHRKR